MKAIEDMAYLKIIGFFFLKYVSYLKNPAVLYFKQKDCKL